MSTFIKVILGFFNNGIPIWVGYSIYNITDNNLLYALVGIIVTYAFTQNNPIVYLIAFPIFEYFYSGSLTNYSYIYIGLVISNMMVVFGLYSE